MITKNILQAKETLLNNELVAIPTETVYGLAGNAYHEEAVHKIFALKKRPLHNPLIVHLKSFHQLEDIAKDIPPIALELAHHFWPGPLTLILKKREHISEIITAGKDTVAVRVPNHPITLALLHELDFPLVAPSANPFGSISPTSAQHVDEYFGKQLETILDGGDCEKGIESTIVGFEGQSPILYRLGSISKEEIENIIGPLPLVNQDDKAPVAPGMLSRHYAPNTDTYLCDDLDTMIKKFDGKKIGLLVFKHFLPKEKIAHQEVLSPSGDLQEAAKNLYAAMHRLDAQKLDVIIAERAPNIGLGRTINDKLERAVKK